MSSSPSPRIFLSPPHLSGREMPLVEGVFASNWVAPAGPSLDAFEKRFSERVGGKHAVAVVSGTAGLHLALQVAGVGPGDEVACSTLTFVASANAIRYLGASPVFIDSDETSWNLDPNRLADFFRRRRQNGRLPKALMLVHLYGQSADIDPIKSLCDEHGVRLIEDAAESLGATYKGRHPGTFGLCGVYSFNGNKIITTSGGGMLVSADSRLVEEARYLATQARDRVNYYQHSQVGYNYRLSNVLAAIGLGQLQVLEERVEARRRIFARYQALLDGLPGLRFMPEAPYGRSSRWLTCVQIDPAKFGVDRETVRLALEAENIESRAVWKPLHLQPIFADCETVGGAVAEKLFDHGLCLPSGSALTDADLTRIAAVVRRCACRSEPALSSLGR